MITSGVFSGRRYAVLGLARSGAAAARALIESGAQVTVWDRRSEPRSEFADACEVADPLTLDLTGFDGIVTSPGVPLNTHPIARHAKRFGVPVIGDIELFAAARRDLPQHLVVGVTGTNGKSTTVALIHHILLEAGRASQLRGNIGEPVMAADPIARNDRGPGVYVLELSSFQIDLTRSLACDVAALTNITPDHLDRYASFEDYAFAKGRLFAMQGSGGLAVFGSSAGPVGAICEAARERRADEKVILADPQALADMQGDWPGLQGPHNLENVGIAVAVVEQLGIGRAQWERALPRFRGLPHRMEIVGEAGGVTFVNDSKATNPASAAPALAAYPRDPAIRERAPRVHWIVGGLAKEDGLGECSEELGAVAAAYTIGEAGPRFAQLLEGRVPRIERAELLGEAVSRASEAARPGDVVLLSPACASYDQFSDYTKRGDCFRKLVGAIAGCGSAKDGAGEDAKHGPRLRESDEAA